MPLSNIVVIVGTVLVVGVFAVRLLASGHPENGCSRDSGPKNSVNDRFYNKADRPAGPDAEDASLERDSPPPKPPTLGRRLRLLRSQ
jgi:hypothetical protein